MIKLPPLKVSKPLIERPKEYKMFQEQGAWVFLSPPEAV
jgi:hypothetical protein